MKKYITIAVVVICSIVSQPVFAQSGDWRSNFRSIFEDTTIQRVDEKIRTKAEEIKKSDILRKETRQDTKIGSVTSGTLIGSTPMQPMDLNFLTIMAIELTRFT